MSPTSYQAALPRVIPSLLSATLIIIPYSNSFVKRVRKVFLQQKQRMKTRLLTFFPESQQPRQFTLLREGRRRLPCDSGSTFKFQFTPLREGRRCLPRLPQAPCYFNSRPSARGDFSTYAEAFAERISIHAPPRGATGSQAKRRLPFGYFNSRPSARGDRKAAVFVVVLIHISIHAPPRGATFRRSHSLCTIRISIHAPPRGATSPPRFPRLRSDFNSRPSARGDNVHNPARQVELISIHAPPRGATRYVMVSQWVENISIHVPPRGATVYENKRFGNIRFQFTPLREGRPVA